MLRQRDFSLLVGAVGLSALGDWLALTPLALHLQEETGSGLVVAAAALVIRGRRASRPSGEVDLGRARDGIIFLVRDRMLAIVMVVAFISLLAMTASAPAEVFFAKDVLEVGDAGFGLLWTAWTVGMALGSLLLARRVAALALGALVCIVIQGLGLALPTLWLVFAFALAAYVVGGLAHGTKNVLVRTLIHERVPARSPSSPVRSPWRSPAGAWRFGEAPLPGPRRAAPAPCTGSTSVPGLTVRGRRR